MACQSETTYPDTLVNGAFTPVKYAHFSKTEGDTCDGFFIDDFFLFSIVVVPPQTTVNYDVRFGGIVFRADVVVNATDNPTSAGISGAVAISADGKQIDFNDSGGNPQSLNITGFWQDGFTALVSASSIPPGSPRTTIEIDSNIINFGMTPNSTFEGTSPPIAPSNLSGELSADVDFPELLNITLTWTSNSANELGFEVQRSTDGSNWETRGFTTAGVTEFVDGSGDLVADENYYYRVRAFRGDGVPANSGFSSFTSTFSLVYAVPDITIVGSGGFSVGGAGIVVLIINPSGIYTIIDNQTHDTLYERTGVTTSVDVKIPDPFVETAYLADD